MKNVVVWIWEWRLVCGRKKYCCGWMYQEVHRGLMFHMNQDCEVSLWWCLGCHKRGISKLRLCKGFPRTCRTLSCECSDSRHDTIRSKHRIQHLCRTTWHAAHSFHTGWLWNFLQGIPVLEWDLGLTLFQVIEQVARGRYKRGSCVPLSIPS